MLKVQKTYVVKQTDRYLGIQICFLVFLCVSTENADVEFIQLGHSVGKRNVVI